MTFYLEPGRYILAVSGGVDSMSLLDMLTKRSAIEIIVAHFNHGIRDDACLDEELVRRASDEHNLKVVVGYGKLGANCSEETAREARYRFLRDVATKYQAKSIITAHHQDDLIETALLNLLRGSGRRGISAIADSDINRPLLNTPKQDIVKYALANKINWREDVTNTEEKYLRNRLRKRVKRLSNKEKADLITVINHLGSTNRLIDQDVATISHKLLYGHEINRSKFCQLPNSVNNELVMYWLKQLGVRQFDHKTINRLTTVLRTGRAGTKHDVLSGVTLKIEKKSAHFATSV